MKKLENNPNIHQYENKQIVIYLYSEILFSNENKELFINTTTV